MLRPNVPPSVLFVLSALFALSHLACSNETILKAGKNTTPAPNSTTTAVSTRSSLDQDVEAMRTADFRFIWVLRRRDGGVIDAADKAVVKANAFDANRRVLSDGDKALILGMNAIPAKERTDALFGYFAIQDLSPEPMPSVIPTAEKTPKPSNNPQ